MKRKIRIIAVLLSVMILFGTIPNSVLAEDLKEESVSIGELRTEDSTKGSCCIRFMTYCDDKIEPVYLNPGDTFDFSKYAKITPKRNGYIFLGWYKSESFAVDKKVNINEKIKVEEDMNFYAKWLYVGVVTRSEKDYTYRSSHTNTSGFEMYGVELRLIEDYTEPDCKDKNIRIRFYTRIRKNLVEEIYYATGFDTVDYGTALIKKETLKTNNGDIMKAAFYSANNLASDYFADKKYFIYTTVVSNIDDKNLSTDFCIAPYIKYKDIHGIERYYFSTEYGTDTENQQYTYYYTSAYRIAKEYKDLNIKFTEGYKKYINYIIETAK